MFIENNKFTENPISCHLFELHVYPFIGTPIDISSLSMYYH